MTEQEAIKELHGIRPRGGIIPQKRAEAIDMAINSIEKQIPKKPIMIWKMNICVDLLVEKYLPTECQWTISIFISIV